ncbi:hypothetical protein IFM12275_47850 [Nocardia sputorum]|nr:hypothetical protein IFM12275_47850 [Nocardia sputorum]
MVNTAECFVNPVSVPVRPGKRRRDRAYTTNHPAAHPADSPRTQGIITAAEHVNNPGDAIGRHNHGKQPGGPTATT